MLKFKIFFLFALLLLITIAAQANEKGLKKTTFIPQWVPQSQFAGYFVAQEKGFYRKHGLEVKILRGGPDYPPSALLKEKRADFGTMFLSTGIQKRSQGLPIVNIGQIVQRSSLMLVAKKSSGIYSPRDINGRKVGLWGSEFQVQPKAFFKKHNLHVTIIPQSATLNLFLRNGVDVASAMWYNEYHTIINSGINPTELTTFFLSEYSVNFPEDGIYCLKKTFDHDPALCRDFVKASLEGWEYAFDNPEPALDIVMKYVVDGNIATNRVHQKWMLERMKDIINPSGNTVPLGTLQAGDYNRVVQELKVNRLITAVPSFSDFFIDCVSHD
ncbi:MAG: ABC transporter substrate-binding protein [Thermodesulfobacteriota bacterium]|nr:MAG: ABC transporter substrate-binding protein [Thermodesulfobacteriota bacterium]